MTTTPPEEDQSLESIFEKFNQDYIDFSNQVFTNVRKVGNAYFEALKIIGQMREKIAQLEAEKLKTPTLIGYSTRDNWWAAEMAKLGANSSKLKARRVFCDLAKGAGHQTGLISDATRAGMLPITSHKVGGDIAGALAGKFDQAADSAGDILAAYELGVREAIWHEPNNDITPDQFVELNLRLIPLMKSAKVRMGTFINGFLLEQDPAKFWAFLPPELVRHLDWVGIDAYHAERKGVPSTTLTPGNRTRLFLEGLDEKKITLPVGIGEYNAFTVEALRDMHDTLEKFNDRIEFACAWSSQTEVRDFRFTGPILDEFNRFLSTR